MCSQDIVERGACGFDAKPELLKDEFGLPLDRRIDDLAGLRIERRKSGNVNCISVTGDGGDRHICPLQVGGERLDADDLSFHDWLLVLNPWHRNRHIRPKRMLDACSIDDGIDDCFGLDRSNDR